MTNFHKAALSAFGDVCARFGLTSVRATTDRWADELVLANSTTAIQIILDHAESRVFIHMWRLRHKGPESWDAQYRMQDPLNGFDFDDLVKMRSPSQTIRQTPTQLRDNIVAMHDLLKEYARLIGQYAVDVLHGDFTVFIDLARIVVERIGELERQGYLVGPEYDSFRRALAEAERTR